MVLMNLSSFRTIPTIETSCCTFHTLMRAIECCMHYIAPLLVSCTWEENQLPVQYSTVLYQYTYIWRRNKLYHQYFQGSSRVPTLLISYHRWSKCASWKQYAVQATIPQGERKFLNEGGLDWRGGRHIRDKLATVCSPPMWGHWAGTGFTHGLCFV